MMKRRPRGFSFVEIVIVLFLTGVILFCVAGLTDRTFKTLKFLQEKSDSLKSATLACQRLATEMGEMVGAPTLGSGSITFIKVKPGSPPGAGNDPLTNPDTWARTYSSTAQIKYSQPSPDRIVRQVGSEPALEVATDVNDFQITAYETAGNYQIVLSIAEDRRVVTFQTVVSCPGVPR